MSNVKCQMSNVKFTRGQSLVELLLVIALSSVVLPALLVGFVSSREGKAQQHQRSEAVAFLKETIEALRSVREKGWESFAVNETFHPKVDPVGGSSWILELGSYTDPDNGLTTSVVVSNVERGTCPGPDCQAIVATGGIVDPSTKKVKATVSWGTIPFVSSIESTLYLTRYLDNNAFPETTEAQFDLGTKTGVDVINTSGGEVVLGAGGGGDWCAPSFATELNLPKTGKAKSVTALPGGGEAYAGTGENASGESFADILITNTNPPTASIYGTIDGYKTNDIFGEPDYGYIATDKPSKEAVIINLSGLPFVESGYFDAPGSNFGESVFVSSNIGYVVVKDKLYNFDLSSKSGSRPALDGDGVLLSKEGTSVYVVGNYAYVSIKGNNDVQLDIVDISNSSNMTKVGSAKINNQSGQDVFVNETETRAYIVTNATSPTEKEFHIVNIESKSSPFKIGSGYYTNGMSPKGVEVVTNNKVIIVGEGGEEYQVVDIANELLPDRCGGLQVDSGVFDSASVLEPDGDAFAYIVTGDAALEFKIIAGGTGGGAYTPSGTFESATFDALSSVAFNRFDVSVNNPLSTASEFQVGVKPPIGGSCSGVTFAASDFVGPSGSSATKFQTATPTPGTQVFSFTVPLDINPGQCFRYRAYLSTIEFTASPTFYDITVNYSP